MALDDKDIQILRLLQQSCKRSTKEISKVIGSPISTVYAKIKRMEKLGVIKNYRAVLNAKELGKGTTAFVLASIAYLVPGVVEPLSQKEIASTIARFPEVQEVHIVSGDWDVLMKVRADSAESIGEFVISKLRAVMGVEKTLTSFVFHTEKETPEIDL